jgi:very-short-patch-repair endonuclease
MILPGTGRGTGEAGGGGAKQTLRRPEVSLARKLRRDMSLPEVLLWQRLRGGKAGAKFRRQHPIGPYVTDFCCRERGLVVEIDGAVHDGRGEYDAVRETFLRENGYRVIRVNASDVLKDIDAVTDAIASTVSHPLHHPSDGPPPRTGEELA